MLASEPDYLIMLDTRGRAFLRIDDSASAFVDFDRLVALAHDETHLWFRLIRRAIAARDLGSTSDAVADFERAEGLSVNATCGLRYRWYLPWFGLSLFEAGRSADAASTLTRALEADNENAMVFAVRGAALAELGRLTDATEDLVKALTIAPRYECARDRLAEVARVDHPLVVSFGQS